MWSFRYLKRLLDIICEGRLCGPSAFPKVDDVADSGMDLCPIIPAILGKGATNSVKQFL